VPRRRRPRQPPPCTPSTSQSLASWGVNNAWPENNNPNCGQHADIVFIFEADETCSATQFLVVMGLPGSNNGNNRGAIWLWDDGDSTNRQPFGYYLDTNALPRNEGNIAIPAGGITVPKYRSTQGLGYRQAHNSNAVNDGIHVAMFNRTGGGSSGCQRVTSQTFVWYWRATAPAEGDWYQMSTTLLLPTVGTPSLGATQFVGNNAPPAFTMRT